jgi:hypothetical protein
MTTMTTTTKPAQAKATINQRWFKQNRQSTKPATTQPAEATIKVGLSAWLVHAFSTAFVVVVVESFRRKSVAAVLEYRNSIVLVAVRDESLGLAVNSFF